MSNALPFTAAGIGGEITFTGTAVQLRRTGLLGKLRQWSGAGLGNKDIAVKSLAGFHLEPPTLMHNGFVQLIYSGSVNAQVDYSSATNDDNCLLFRKGALADFERLRDMVLQQISAT